MRPVGGVSRPAARSAREAAGIGKAQQVGHLSGRERRIRRILTREPPARVVEQAAETGALLLQLALHAAQAHVERARHGLLAHLAGRKRARELRAYALADITRVEPRVVLHQRLLVDAEEQRVRRAER